MLDLKIGLVSRHVGVPWLRQTANGDGYVGAAQLMLNATDGVDEYWTVLLPRVISRQKLAVPTSVFAVETTDTGQRWVVDGGGGTVSLAPEGAAASARLRGDAESVLLTLWGRPVPDGVVEVSGDRAVADAWLALGGA